MQPPEEKLRLFFSERDIFEWTITMEQWPSPTLIVSVPIEADETLKNEFLLYMNVPGPTDVKWRKLEIL